MTSRGAAPWRRTALPALLVLAACSTEANWPATQAADEELLASLERQQRLCVACVRPSPLAWGSDEFAGTANMASDVLKAGWRTVPLDFGIQGMSDSVTQAEIRAHLDDPARAVATQLAKRFAVLDSAKPIEVLPNPVDGIDISGLRTDVSDSCVLLLRAEWLAYASRVDSTRLGQQEAMSPIQLGLSAAILSLPDGRVLWSKSGVSAELSVAPWPTGHCGRWSDDDWIRANSDVTRLAGPVADALCLALRAGRRAVLVPSATLAAPTVRFGDASP